MRISDLYEIPDDTMQSVKTRPKSDARRLVLYARYSAPTYSGSNAKSADQQLEVLEEWAAEEGHTVVAKFKDESVSGSILQRKGWLDAMKTVEADLVDGMGVLDISRATRSRRHGMEILDVFQRHNVDFYVPGIGRVDSNLAADLIVRSQSSISYSRTGTRVSLRKKIQAGHNCARPPFGYQVDKSGKGRLLKVEEETETRLEIAEDFLTGVSVADIARKLNGRGLTHRNGKPFTPKNLVGTLRRPGILRHPLLGGFTVSGRQSIVGWTDTGKIERRSNHPSIWNVGYNPDLAIMDKERYVTIQRILDARSRPRKADGSPGDETSHRGPRALTSGKFRCPSCRSKMVITNRNAVTGYAACKKAQMGPQFCKNRERVRTDIVERALADRVRSMMASGDLERVIFEAGDRQAKANRQFNERDLHRAEKAFAVSEKKIARIMGFITDGRGVGSINDRELARLEEEREKALADIRAAKDAIADLVKAEPPIEQLRRGVADLRRVLAANDNPTPDHKTSVAEAFRSLFDEILVVQTEDRHRMTVTGPIAFEVDLVRRKRGRPAKAA